jgi:hypothetical protein
MSGFGGMKKQRQEPGPPPDPDTEFENAVLFIFPNSPASRLARACGGVNHRTAQKWMSGQITPPADVRAYVRKAVEELDRTKFYLHVEALLADHAGKLDGEVVAAQLARFYEEISAYKAD